MKIKLNIKTKFFGFSSKIESECQSLKAFKNKFLSYDIINSDKKRSHNDNIYNKYFNIFLFSIFLPIPCGLTDS